MKNKILTMLFCVFIGVFFIVNLVVKDITLFFSERRYLTKLPELSVENIFNGSIMDKFEGYATDHFVLRDEFRRLKVYMEFNLFGKLDYNNLYVQDNYIYKIEYPLKENNVGLFVDKMNNLYNTYLTNMNVYYSIIPDKNYYADNDFLKMNYDELFKLVVNNMDDNMEYIDITNCLDISDYYYTDIHFRQEKLFKLVNVLSGRMHFNVGNDFVENTFNAFAGAYYGQIGLKVPYDNLVYLTNDTIENATVYDVDSDLKTVYEIESLGKMDSYDVYLGGATPIVEITNNNKTDGKELIMFRDSFGSSLAPLLLEGYSKITLVDLRYISSSLLEKYIEFNDQDVLLFYSTTIINNSEMLK